MKQAVDYGANQGIEWIALTNGSIWKVFRVIFAKPIDAEVVLDIDLLSLNHKDLSHLESLFLLTRESMLKSGLYAYHDQLQATNKFYLGAVLLGDAVLESMRRELRRLSPEVKVQIEDLRSALKQEVLKREVIEGDKAEAARKKLQKLLVDYSAPREKTRRGERASPISSAALAPSAGKENPCWSRPHKTVAFFKL